MKKILTLFGICMCLVSCSYSTTNREDALIERKISYENTEEAMSKYDYSPYYNTKGMKGTEVYCWEIEENIWRCGAMLGTNRNKTLDELLWMQNDLPCTLKKMNEILSTYTDEERRGITLYEIPYPMTVEIYNTSFLNYNSENLPFLVSELGLTNK